MAVTRGPRQGQDGRRARLRAWLKGTVTLMAIPARGTVMHQWVVRRSVILVIGLAVTGVMGSAVFVLGRRIDYGFTFRENIELKEEVQRFTEEITRVRQAGESVASMQESLRKLLGLKTKESIVRQSGIGGGPKEGSSKGKPFGKVREEVDRLSQATEGYENSFAALERHIEGLRSLYRATPLGSPVRGGWITSRYGKRRGLDLHAVKEEWHKGVDIASGHGVQLRATADGRVLFAGRRRDYGRLVIIHHGHGFSTRYAHNSKNLVKEGDRVTRGQKVALMGSTGNATGPHVHYEVRQRGKAVNPITFIRRKW